MKKYKELVQAFDNRTEYSIKEFLERELSRSYADGELEFMREQLSKVTDAFARLCTVLHEEKGTLSIDEVFYIGTGSQRRGK